MRIVLAHLASFYQKALSRLRESAPCSRLLSMSVMDFVARIHVDSFASIRRMDYCNAVVCPYHQCSGTVFAKLAGESHTGACARVLGYVARSMFLCAHGQPGLVVQGGIFVDTEHDATQAHGVPTSHEGGVKIMRSLFTISYDLYMTRRYPYLMLWQLCIAQLLICSFVHMLTWVALQPVSIQTHVYI